MLLPAGAAAAARPARGRTRSASRSRTPSARAPKACCASSSCSRESDRAGAREAGEALEVIRDFGLARLGFGDGSTPRPTARSGRSRRSGCPASRCPNPRAARDTYTRAERVSVATLSLVAAYALRLISGTARGTRSCCWTRCGSCSPHRRAAQIINRLVRLGRAFNATVLLGTHRIGDLGRPLGPDRRGVRLRPGLRRRRPPRARVHRA